MIPRHCFCNDCQSFFVPIAETFMTVNLHSKDAFVTVKGSFVTVRNPVFVIKTDVFVHVRGVFVPARHEHCKRWV